MNLLMFHMSNVHDWQQGIVNRNFFVAQELLRSPYFEKVFFVDFLAVQSHKKAFGVRRSWQYARSLGQTPHSKRQGLFHSVTQRQGKPFGDGAKAYHNYQGLGALTMSCHDFKRIGVWLQEQGVQPNNLAVWSYNAFLPEALHVPSALKIFDAVDDWSLHASYKKESALLKQNYAQIGASADVIFTVSDGLRTLFPDNKAHWIPNGVDVDAFAQVAPIPNDIADLKKPVIGYIGTVQERLDFELLEYVCKRHLDKTFVFIGPVWGGVKAKQERLQRACANVRFLGRRSYHEVPAYLQAMDAAIIPHRLDAFINSTNPMKMYDYLAAGKPVITTPGAGTDVFETRMYVAQTPQSFAQAIDQALAENTPHVAAQRRQAVQAHTWRARVTDMLALLNRK